MRKDDADLRLEDADLECVCILVRLKQCDDAGVCSWMVLYVDVRFYAGFPGE